MGGLREKVPLGEMGYLHFKIFTNVVDFLAIRESWREIRVLGREARDKRAKATTFEVKN